MVISYDHFNLDLTVAAVLHDTVEDGADNVRRATGREVLPLIGELFGRRVADTVHLVTNDPDMGYTEHAVASFTSSADARVVKTGDLVDNITGIADTVTTDRRKAKLAGKYRPLVTVAREFTDGGSGRDAVVHEKLTGLVPFLDSLS